MTEAALAPPGITTTPIPSLRRRAICGSLWALGGHGIRQIIRLASSLLLTRLLFPEAFGLMALVQVFLQGLEMFSDLGLQPNIIQNQRGEDPNFLNTAWTMQVVRGLLLGLGACALAAPLAAWYHEPQLALLLPVAAVSCVIAGFRSTKWDAANRKLQLGRITLIEVAGNLLSVVVMAALAWHYRSVWALAAGSLVGQCFGVACSHLLLDGAPNRFQWDRAAARELWKFGRWIFVGTLLAYFASQGDRLVMGRLLDVRFLGVYGVALTLSRATAQAVAQVCERVLFPSYAELVRERPERLYATLRTSRLGMLALTWAVALLLIVGGEPLVRLLYDQRYADAGWMLRLVSVGTLMHMLGQSYNGVLLAHGQSRALAIILGTTAAVQLATMLLGAHWGGAAGLIYGIVVVSWLIYPLEAFFYRRINVWQPEIDLPLYALATAVAAAVIYGSAS